MAIIPLVLGDGIPLFPAGTPELPLHLGQVRAEIRRRAACSLREGRVRQRASGAAGAADATACVIGVAMASGSPPTMVRDNKKYSANAARMERAPDGRSCNRHRLFQLKEAGYPKVKLGQAGYKILKIPPTALPIPNIRNDASVTLGSIRLFARIVADMTDVALPALVVKNRSHVARIDLSTPNQVPRVPRVQVGVKHGGVPEAAGLRHRGRRFNCPGLHDRELRAGRARTSIVITWKVPLQKEAKTNFSCVIGSVAHEDVEPGFCTVGLLADPLKMRVRTYDVTGKPAKRPFHLARVPRLVSPFMFAPPAGGFDGR